MRGEVIYSRQEPVVGAAVILLREGDPGKLAIATTDHHGYFRLESIPEGSYSIGIVKEGAEPVIKAGVPVKPPVRAIVDIVLKKKPGPWTHPVIDIGRYEKKLADEARAAGAAAGQGSGSAATPGSQESNQSSSAAPSPDSQGTPDPSSTPASPGTGGGTAEAGAAGAPSSTPIGSVPANPGAQSDTRPEMIVQVIDSEVKPIREAQVLLRSRGPAVNPVRRSTDENGIAKLKPQEPGEYLLRVAVPGYLPARVDRLVLGRTPPRIYVVLTARPLDYPASPAELLPEEKPVPPVGFPGGPTLNP